MMWQRPSQEGRLVVSEGREYATKKASKDNIGLWFNVAISMAYNGRGCLHQVFPTLGIVTILDCRRRVSWGGREGQVKGNWQQKQKLTRDHSRFIRTPFITLRSKQWCFTCRYNIPHVHSSEKQFTFLRHHPKHQQFKLHFTNQQPRLHYELNRYSFVHVCFICSLAIRSDPSPVKRLKNPMYVIIRA